MGIAATYTYEWALKKVKDRWAEQQDWNNPTEEGHFWNVIDCCALKALTGWSVGIIADNCRERCGGMGYLEANRFGYAIAGSHSSRTAEGDNSVLMNKVASEIIQKQDKTSIVKVVSKAKLGQILQKVVPFYVENSMSNITVDSLIANMEIFKDRSLADLAMQMNNDKDKGRYTAWMELHQNLVQQAARGYSEWRVAVDAKERIGECTNPNLKNIMDELLLLYLVDCIRNNAGEYTKHNLLSNGSYLLLDNKFNDLCRSVGRNSVNLTDAFGFSNEMLATPCALDWIDYNAVDNQGEVVDFLSK